MSTPHQSRADRRRATEARILDSARELFAEKGFERTTIRAVATAASVDPALVMQYFGSKRELFSQAVQTLPGPLTATDADELVDQLLASLGLKLGGLPEGALAMMRSMLTDQAAADHVRAALGRQIDSVGAALPAAEDAELRAALVVTALLGVTIGHRLLGLATLREVPADHIAALLRPAIKALTGPQG
ncbi:TetR family transcriptional regulator [Streptomyces spinosirectus]|uniref:TetR/AcrR family transcriptional regulator n=1 Tax=Streptomyces TaxID=1883 RepID=UPI000D3AD920|nr:MULTISPECIES: TetR family transcriptional regulator [Streptomyces]MBY8341913.1 TetR family transcriptional regulator [Streptomyces plumbidurans]PTM97102.1 TetR family transcriptional regulator [Streptomyces sp. VMFN-G11Ma]UIR16738.1 TetR family transcriptional regulator [Streptomyces spinosirectus]